MFRKFIANDAPRWRMPIPLALIAACAVLLLAACTGVDPVDGPTRSPSGTSPARTGRLTPYHTPSPTTTPSPTFIPTETPTPLPPTPTPITHVVQQGEDMFGIAIRYRIGLAELTAANPTVNPNLMSVGTVLVIPVSTTPMPTQQQSIEESIAQIPTAIPVQVGPLHCARARDGGVWCFQVLTNNQSFTLESLTAAVYLRDSQGQTLTQQAALPLDTLPPGASLPLAAYFPPDGASIPEPFQASSEMLTALPNRDDGRYLPSSPQNQKVFISPDGLTAEVTLEVVLENEEQQANRVWVAAVAYDSEGQVVGLRRWEKPSGEPLTSGEALPVSLMLYSTSGEIQRVDLLSEARP